MFREKMAMNPTVRHLHCFPYMRTKLAEHPVQIVHQKTRNGRCKRMGHSRRKSRHRRRDDLQKRRRDQLDVLLVLFDILVTSLRRIELVTAPRRQSGHGLDQWNEKAAEVCISMYARKSRKQTSATRVAAEELSFVLYNKKHASGVKGLSWKKQARNVPVRAISRSTRTFIKFMREVRVSKILSSTGITWSISPGGQVSQIARTRTIYETRISHQRTTKQEQSFNTYVRTFHQLQQNEAISAYIHNEYKRTHQNIPHTTDSDFQE